MNNFADAILPKSFVAALKTSFKSMGVGSVKHSCVIPFFEQFGFVGIAMEAVLGLLLIIGFMHLIVALQDRYIYSKRRRMPKPPYMAAKKDEGIIGDILAAKSKIKGNAAKKPKQNKKDN
jgi:hypothetical protein